MVAICKEEMEMESNLIKYFRLNRFFQRGSLFLEAKTNCHHQVLNVSKDAENGGIPWSGIVPSSKLSFNPVFKKTLGGRKKQAKMAARKFHNTLPDESGIDGFPDWNSFSKTIPSIRMVMTSCSISTSVSSLSCKEEIGDEDEGVIDGGKLFNADFNQKGRDKLFDFDLNELLVLHGGDEDEGVIDGGELFNADSNQLPVMQK